MYKYLIVYTYLPLFSARFRRDEEERRLPRGQAVDGRVSIHLHSRRQVGLLKHTSHTHTHTSYYIYCILYTIYYIVYLSCL